MAGAETFRQREYTGTVNYNTWVEDAVEITERYVEKGPVGLYELLTKLAFFY